MAAGDTMLARSIGKRLRKHPDAPLAGVADTFAKADLTLLNLECTISVRGTPNPIKSFTFRAPPVSARSLADAGVDLVTLANNHAMDYGPVALADTISLLGDQGIGTIGAGADSSHARAPLIFDRNGLRVAFLGYLEGFTDASGWSALSWEATATAPGVAIARLAHIRSDVADAKRHADVVVVMFHSGLAQIANPTSLQRKLADTALAAGASLVINASPHRLQGTRRSGNTFIAYSLGNFVFDQSRGVFNDSAILDVTLDKSGVKSVRFVPVVIRDGFPVLAHGADAARILRELRPI
jgi:poly-gamma-glutamate capsule biosynthesis protein CapA/YwtB (metallophosphatase superfamily)